MPRDAGTALEVRKGEERSVPCELSMEHGTQDKERGCSDRRENGGNAYLNGRYLLDVGCSTFSASIAKGGSMIPIYVSDATSHIDKAAQNSACLGGERERGASMRIKDRKYG